MVVKVCGMTDEANLLAIAIARPDYFGFIFYDKSPRSITGQSLPTLEGIKKIGVFVDAPLEQISQRQTQFSLNGIQLHGKEDIEYIEALKTQLPGEVTIFKAISVYDANDIKSVNDFDNYVDVIILDTKTPLKGGSGKQFDWDLLQYYQAELPFLLSGGISAEDADELFKLKSRFPQMIGVDVNSKFETRPGLKQVDQTISFINKLKSE